MHGSTRLPLLHMKTLACVQIFGQNGLYLEIAPVEHFFAKYELVKNMVFLITSQLWFLWMNSLTSLYTGVLQLRQSALNAISIKFNRISIFG